MERGGGGWDDSLCLCVCVLVHQRRGLIGVFLFLYHFFVHNAEDYLRYFLTPANSPPVCFALLYPIAVSISTSSAAA